MLFIRQKLFLPKKTKNAWEVKMKLRIIPSHSLMQLVAAPFFALVLSHPQALKARAQANLTKWIVRDAIELQKTK